MIYKIDTLLYGIKLGTKLLRAFSYRQSRSCKDDISEAKCLLLSQIKTLLLKVLEKQLDISRKLVKGRFVTTIGVIAYLSLTR